MKRVTIKINGWQFTFPIEESEVEGLKEEYKDYEITVEEETRTFIGEEK